MANIGAGPPSPAFDRKSVAVLQAAAGVFCLLVAFVAGVLWQQPPSQWLLFLLLGVMLLSGSLQTAWTQSSQDGKRHWHWHWHWRWGAQSKRCRLASVVSLFAATAVIVVATAALL